MTPTSKRPVRRLLAKIFPPAPDFLGMLAEHAALLHEAHAALKARIQVDAARDDLAAIVARGTQLRRRHIDALNKTFITPIDREDIYLATQRLSQVLEYIESTEREMSLLEVEPDAFIVDMLDVLGVGIGALEEGFAKLDGALSEAESFAVRAIDSERRMEELYRRALAELFHGEAVRVTREQEAPAAACLEVMVNMLKAREIYRHLSNAADRVALAGETLHDIVVKWA